MQRLVSQKMIVDINNRLLWTSSLEKFIFFTAMTMRLHLQEASCSKIVAFDPNDAFLLHSDAYKDFHSQIIFLNKINLTTENKNL